MKTNRTLLLLPLLTALWLLSACQSSTPVDVDPDDPEETNPLILSNTDVLVDDEAEDLPRLDSSMIISVLGYPNLIPTKRFFTGISLRHRLHGNNFLNYGTVKFGSVTLNHPGVGYLLSIWDSSNPTGQVYTLTATGSSAIEDYSTTISLPAMYRITNLTNNQVIPVSEKLRLVFSEPVSPASFFLHLVPDKKYGPGEELPAGKKFLTIRVSRPTKVIVIPKPYLKQLAARFRPQQVNYYLMVANGKFRQIDTLSVQPKAGGPTLQLPVYYRNRYEIPVILSGK
ncbi:MAG: hypothetical protein HUU10_10050 [Bacteroidetes bacterium]|nr:hypothetical protein [Bacteroidota bacterium]